MALLKTVELSGKTLNRIYRVDSCFPFRNRAKIEMVYWYISDQNIINKDFPKPVNGVHVNFDGAEQYEAAGDDYDSYFSNSVLIEAGNSPFKNAYEYVKTLPVFASATGVDV